MSIGVAVTITIAPQHSPTALESDPAPTGYPVESERTQDERDVQVRIEHGTAQVVRTSVDEGTVTASRCSPGDAIASGSWTFAIDGAPRPNLGTTSPFWRDLQEGDAGDDVRAIQAELKRLGYQLRSDGTYGRETAAALERLLLRNGVRVDITKEGHDVVPAFRRSDWIWIPSATATPSSCDVDNGTPVSENEALATLEATVRSLDVATMPDDLVPGARVLSIGDQTVPVDENGIVSAESASALQITPDGGRPGPDSSGGDSTPSSPASEDGEQTVQAVLRLTEPRRLWSVPASLLFGFTSDNSACLRTAGSVLPVEVVGSRLGSSLVLPERGEIGSTAYVPRRDDHSCS